MRKGMQAVGLSLAGLALALAISGTALAQGPVQESDGAQSATGRYGAASGWVAAGTQTRTRAEDCVLADGAGTADPIRERAGQGTMQGGPRARGTAASGGLGAGFVDADGDGVCDALGNRQAASGGLGADFVDADGDGVCDRLGSGQAASGAYGRGNR